MRPPPLPQKKKKIEKSENMYKIHYKICSIDFSEILCDDRFIWTYFGIILTPLYFLCHMFPCATCHNSVLELKGYCYFVYLFSHPTFIKVFGKCISHTHYNVCRTRTILYNYSSFSHISIAKSVNTSFVNITFSCCLCSSSSPSSRFSASLIRNIEEFGAKRYLTDHRTSNAIHLFVPVKRKFFGSILFQNKSQ